MLEPRHRSVGFLQHEGESWACFLVTFRGRDGLWRGHFAFRPQDGNGEDGDVQTADIFIESSESEVHQKARGLGKPLLGGLLSSALHMREKRSEESDRLRSRFRELLAENSRELVTGAEAASPSETELRSLYESYRLDQVAHLIALVRPEDFDEAVDRILSGQSVDFGARDRIQFAMMVVEFLEARLPLPPFEVWAEDYLAHAEEYARYAHTLHREGRLP